jgi:hypothetical protein
MVNGVVNELTIRCAAKSKVSVPRLHANPSWIKILAISCDSDQQQSKEGGANLFTI